MHEELEKKMTHAEGLIAAEHLKTEASPEEEMTEAGLMLEDAKTDIEEFVTSGLPIAEKIATEMGDKIDPETKTALVELNQQAELARQMLADSLVGKLRLKSADFLKKHLPGSGLTALAERKNAEIVSKRTVEKLHGFLFYSSLSGYEDVDQAADYFEKHKDLLVGEDRGKLESEILEATKTQEQIKADNLSRKTVKELQELLEYDYDKGDYKDADQAADYFEKHKDLLAVEDRDKLESDVLHAVNVHKQGEAELLSKKTVEELQELLKYDSDERDYKQATQAVEYFLKHKDSIVDGYEKETLERNVFAAIEQHLQTVAGNSYEDDEGSFKNALAEYKSIPNEFFKDKNIAQLGYHIYNKTIRKSAEPEEIMAAFEGNLDLLAAGSRYQRSYDNFSSEDKVKIVEETYKKRGASEYIAKYNARDFEDGDREKILKPLFESYKDHNQGEILSQINIMKSMYDLLPPEECNQLIESLIENSAEGVFNSLDQLNLNGEQKKLLVEKIIQHRYYPILQSEDNLEKLGANKDEIFSELLEKDAVDLFAHRGGFNPSPEQYKLLLDSVTGNLDNLEGALGKIYHGYYGDTGKLTEEELQIFKTIVEKDAPYLIHRFRIIFKEEFKEQKEFFKELPSSLFEDGLEGFVRHVVRDLGGWEKNVERVRALVIESGEQKVTNEYLGQLDNIGLKLPNRVMGKIKENIKKAEQKNLLDYFGMALEKNTTLEQVQREAQQRLEQVTTNADYFKAVHSDVLKNVLTDCRFKTQFETHSSNGTLNPRYRAEQEEKMFNYVGDEEKGQSVRPNYGYMSDNENGLVGSFSDSSVSSNVSQYGCIHVKFKKDKVANRTTVTFDDSLSGADENPPTPSMKPHFASLRQRQDPNKIEHASRPGEWGSSYLEVQYHWPLRTSLIESIHISEKNSLSKEAMREVEEMVRDYNEQNPNDKIKVITY